MSIGAQIEMVRNKLDKLILSEEKGEKYYKKRYELSIKLDKLIIRFYEKEGNLLCK